MSTPGPTGASPPPPSVFLSYASEDRPAAQSLRDALQKSGLDVLYDESSLVGGDAWDQKIRRQIRDCDYFMPVISAGTEARAEGYFRREWRLAVERTLDMADDHIFLLPVVIDGTSDLHARVPEKFKMVQWLRVPDGRPTAALEELCRRLLAGEPIGGSRPTSRAPGRPASMAANEPASNTTDEAARRRSRTPPPPPEYPAFPREEPGQKTRFWLEVIGWLLRWAWLSFNRFPKWVRVCVYIWLAIGALTLWDEKGENASSGHITAADSEKIKEITDKYQGSSDKADWLRLGAEIAREFTDDSNEHSAASPVLAAPFSAPAGDSAAEKLANAAFAQVYGRIAISSHGHVGLTTDLPSTSDPAAAAKEGRAHHAKYVLYGAVDHQPPGENLTVSLVMVSDGSLLWSKSYPLASADPAAIAAEVDSKVPKADDD